MRKTQTVASRVFESEPQVIRRQDRVTYVAGVRDQDACMAQARRLIHDWSSRFPDVVFRLKPIKCRADRFSLSPYNTFHSLADFSDELDAALKNGDIDFTIQFLHECPEEADPLIDTVALTPREDARDLLVMPRSRTIADLRPGDRVGYYSERQRYQFDRLVPDLQYRQTAGHIQPRLEKLASGEFDALIVSAIEIIRINPSGYALSYQPISPELMCPPPGRGIAAVRMLRSRRELWLRFRQTLDHAPSRACYAVEQAVQEALGHPFDRAVGIYCEEAGDALFLRAVNGMGGPSQMLAVATAVSRQFSSVPDPDKLVSAMHQLMGDAALIGMGGGPVSTLTERARECLAHADLVVYDHLRQRTAKIHTPDGAVWAFAGPPDSSVAAQPAADPLPLMIDGARTGKRVVRLYGDELLSAAGGYAEARALAATGIRYELVPGVHQLTSVLAMLGLPLTAVPGQPVHLLDGRIPPGDAALRGMAAAGGTWCFMQAGAGLPALVAALGRAGLPGHLPAMLVCDPWLPTHRRISGELAELPALGVAADMPPDAMLLIGDICAPSQSLDWWPPRGALSGRTVGIVASRWTDQRSQLLSEGIRAMGGTPQLVEWMQTRMDGEIAEQFDRQLGAALAGRFGSKGVLWLVVTGSSGVLALAASLHRMELDFRTLGAVRLAALSPGTAAALKKVGLAADYVPQDHDHEHLASGLIQRLHASDRVALIRGARQSQTIAMMMQMASVPYTDCVAFDTGPADCDHDTLLAVLDQVNVLTFTTAGSVYAFLRALNDAGLGLADVEDRGIEIVAQGQMAARAVEHSGLPLHGVSPEATTEGLLRFLADMGG